jgi:site-specific recombinase XerD
MAESTARTLAHTTTNAEIARTAFLTRHQGATRGLYELDLRLFYDWCASIHLDPLAARRANLEMFAEHLRVDRGNKATSVKRRLQVVRQFYRLAVADELIDRDPTVMLQMRKTQTDPSKIAWLEPHQVVELLRVAKAESPAHHALIALMSMLALRVSEACNVRIEDFGEDADGYRILRVVGKGGRVDDMPVPVPLWRIVQTAMGDRTTGPVVLRRSGQPQSRHGAYSWVKILARKAGLRDDLHPHALRHSSVSAAILGGADLRQARAFARHADLRTTEHYIRTKPAADAAHLVARMFGRAA